MRLVPVPTREKPGEGGWVIAAEENVINLVFSEKRLNYVTAKKTREGSCFKIKPSEASKILQSFMFGLREGGCSPRSPAD
jgi:hypothetical protein